jgi:hypothetical protein
MDTLYQSCLELYDAAFSGVNIAYTVLLLAVFVYWSIIVLGVLDFNLFDVDVEAGDLGADGDLATDGTTDGVGGFSWLNYFNIGEVPIVMYATIVVLVMWIVSLQINDYLDGSTSQWVQTHRGWIAAGLAVPNFLFGMHVAKFLMLPVKRMKRQHKVVVDHDGKQCLVRSLEVNDKYGQVEVPTDESPILLNARTENGELLVKGEAATVVRHVASADQEYFVVTKSES